MKVLAIIGSLRKKSYNRSVFNYYQKMAQGTLELVEGTFADFPLFSQDIQEAGFPPSVITLAEQIRVSDGVIFFSPEYNTSIPGVLKNAIDWVSRVERQPFAGKPCSVISASPGRLGGGRMQYHLRQVFVPLDAHFMNQPEVMISGVHKLISEQGELNDASTQKFLKAHMDAFVKFVVG